MPVGILQKAVDELNKPKPNLQYLRGLLETLIELQPKPPTNIPFAGFTPPPPPSKGKAIVIGKLPQEPVIQSEHGTPK